MYEGAPRPSKPGAFWEVIQKHRCTIFYTAPTAIRAFMKSGREVPDRYDMSSLRILGTVGEPINPEAWMWYRDVIGGDRCPIVDTWWQNRDRGRDDQPPARCDAHQAWFRHPPLAGN